MKIFSYALLILVLITSANVNAEVLINGQTGLPDFAGIYQDGGGSMTILLVEGFEKITTFSADGPETVSNGAHGTDDITIGATGVYFTGFDAGVLAGAVNKNYEIFAFEIAATPSGTAITAVTKAAAAEVTTSSAHGLTNGDRVKLVGVTGMSEVDDNIYTVAGSNTTTFTLATDDVTDVNSSGYGNPGTGGYVYPATKIIQVHGHVRLGTNNAQASTTGHGHVSLTGSNTVELYVKGATDATDVTIENASFHIQRVQ